MRIALLSLVCASALITNLSAAQTTPTPPTAPTKAQATPPTKAPPPGSQVAQAAPAGSQAAPQNAQPPHDAPLPPAGEAPPSAVVQAPPDMIGGSVPPLDAPPPPPPPVAPPLPPRDPRGLLNEIALTEDQIEDVRAQRDQYPIGGPIAMTAVGYGGALLFGLAAIAAWGAAEDVDRGLDARDPDYDEFRRSDVDRARMVSRVIGGMSILPLALGIVGSVMLTQRLEERRRFGPELRSLTSRKRAIERELRYGVDLAPRAAALTLKATF